MDYNNLIKSSINIFSNYFIIDIINDKVFEYDQNISLVKEDTFYNFVENMKRIIHVDSINKYFEFISLKKLTEEKEKGNNVIICNYKKLVNNIYKDFASFAKLIENSGNKYIVIFETDIVFEKELSINNSNDIENEKVTFIANKVSEVILKVFNTINQINDNSDMLQVKHCLDYITNIINTLVREIPELNKSLTNEMILNVNKNKPTLLIVDDDLMTRNLIKKAFSDEFEILMATNGQVAIDIFEKNRVKSDTEIRDNIVGVFLDLAMPVLDGFGVLEYLKLNNILNKIPVIIISAAEEKATRQKAYQYGIADMIEKPFNLELIKYRTNNLINLYKTSNSINEIISKKRDRSNKIINNILTSYLKDNEQKINYINKISEFFLNKIMIENPQYRLNNDVISKVLESIKYYDIGTYLISKNIDKKSKEYLKHIDLGIEFIEYGLKDTIEKDLYKYVVDIIKYHHELYDGTGYNKINGDMIPIYVQIIILAIECANSIVNQISLNDLYNNIISQENTKYSSVIVNLFKNYYLNLFS